MTFVDFLNSWFTGNNLALLGAGLAVVFSGIGSAKGVGMVCSQRTPPSSVRH